MLLQSGKIHGREVLFAIIAELTVYLIGVEIEIVFFCHLAQHLKLFLRIEVAGGIVGITNDNSPGISCDNLFKFLYGRKCKTVFNSGSYGDYFYTCRYRETIVIGIEWFRNDHFFAGINRGHQCKSDCLRSSCGD